MWSGWRTATGGRPGTDVVTAYLALGSNVGDREAHLAHAVGGLAAAGRVTGLSSVYETDPVGYADQDPFLNMVVRLETTVPPAGLLALGRRLEAERGRQRTFRNAPRTLDVDILLYGHRQVDEPGLTIPHPRMTGRPFVLVPLLEIDPALEDPVTGRPYGAMLEGDAGSTGIRRLYAGERLGGRDGGVA